MFGANNGLEGIMSCGAYGTGNCTQVVSLITRGFTIYICLLSFNCGFQVSYVTYNTCCERFSVNLWLIYWNFKDHLWRGCFLMIDRWIGCLIVPSHGKNVATCMNAKSLIRTPTLNMSRHHFRHYLSLFPCVTFNF
jgi:hypothetical protein